MAGKQVRRRYSMGRPDRIGQATNIFSLIISIFLITIILVVGTMVLALWMPDVYNSLTNIPGLGALIKLIPTPTPTPIPFGPPGVGGGAGTTTPQGATTTVIGSNTTTIPGATTTIFNRDDYSCGDTDYCTGTCPIGYKCMVDDGWFGWDCDCVHEGTMEIHDSWGSGTYDCGDFATSWSATYSTPTSQLSGTCNQHADSNCQYGASLVVSNSMCCAWSCSSQGATTTVYTTTTLAGPSCFDRCVSFGHDSAYENPSYEDYCNNMGFPAIYSGWCYYDCSYLGVGYSGDHCYCTSKETCEQGDMCTDNDGCWTPATTTTTPATTTSLLSSICRNACANADYPTTSCLDKTYYGYCWDSLSNPWQYYTIELEMYNYACGSNHRCCCQDPTFSQYITCQQTCINAGLTPQGGWGCRMVSEQGTCTSLNYIHAWPGDQYCYDEMNYGGGLDNYQCCCT